MRTLKIIIGVALGGIILTACQAWDTFDASERQCKVTNQHGEEVDICPAANTEQVLVQAELTEGTHAVTGPLGIATDDQLTEEAYVVCSDSGTMFGVVSSAPTGVTPRFTTGQINGENFLPIAYMPADSLVNPAQTQERLEESVSERHDTNDISCENPLLALSTKEKEQLETIRQ